MVSYGGLTTVTNYHLVRKNEHVVDSGERVGKQGPTGGGVGVRGGGAGQTRRWLHVRLADACLLACPLRQPLHPPLLVPIPCAHTIPALPSPGAVFMHDNFRTGADESSMVVVTKTHVYAVEGDDSEDDE